MVKSLALSLGVMQSIPSEKSTERFSENDLWYHSVVVATALKELTRRFGEKKNSDSFFIIGLLHDIGIVILDQFFPNQFRVVLDELNNMERCNIHIVEKSVLGIDHGEIGAMLLERWKFPPEVRYPIAVHHQETIPEGINVYDVSMLRVADILSHEIDSRKRDGNPELPSIDEKDLILLKMDEQDLEEMKAYLNGAKEEINTFFTAII
jgi:putative nucleotidyltransferase with HDIG domain